MRPISLRSRAPLMAGLAVLASLLAACGGGQAAGEEATEFVHTHGLAVDPSSPNVLWVATHRGLIRGTDDQGWLYASEDRNDHMGFTLDPTSGMLFRSGHPESGGNLGVESSSDGRVWEHLSDVLSPPVDFHAMTLSFAEPAVMYGWDSGGRGLFRSKDAGRNWELLPLADQVFALAAPAATGVLFAGTPKGLLRSDDDGETWTRLDSLGTGPVIALAADPADAKHLLAYVQEGVQVSRDGGATWSPASRGVPPGELIGALAISPHDPDEAYAAGVTTIYKTTDGGSSWSVIRSGS